MMNKTEVETDSKPVTVEDVIMGLIETPTHHQEASISALRWGQHY